MKMNALADISHNILPLDLIAVVVVLLVVGVVVAFVVDGERDRLGL
jgi:hypothetical protein